MTGIIDEVTKASVGVLLIERSPNVLDRVYGNPPESVFDAFVQQIAAEVIPVTGPDPQGATRQLALQCMAYGIASSVEYAEFPEQQGPGGAGRGWFLKQKFNELLAMLRGMPGADGTVAGISRATFPPPQRYPDPFRPR
ncbi:hypothetical protein [Microbacterium sp. KNMS]